MDHLFSFLLSSNIVAWFAFAVSLVTLVLKTLEYRTKISVPKIYITEPIMHTQKIILVLSNASSHPISVTDLTFETSDLECFKPKFGNYKVWSNQSYVRYTDILPVTFAPNESKLLIFEIDSEHKHNFSTIKVSTVKKTYSVHVVNQSNIERDKLATIR